MTNIDPHPIRSPADAPSSLRMYSRGVACLPMVLMGEEVLTEGRYPIRDEVLARHG